MVKISVVLPCYNVEKWIDRCLESIFRQTIGIDNYEVICVDDCSTDSTVMKLEEWEKKYPDNLMVIRCEVNARQGAARNIGMQYANGEFLAFVDSDDWLELDYLEKLYAAAKGGDYEIVYCGHGRDFSKTLTFFNEIPVDASVKDIDKLPIPKGEEFIIDSEEKRKKHIIVPQIGYAAWAKFIRKDFLIDNGLVFPENLTYEDAGWGSLVNLYFTRAYVVHEKLYHYFVNDESTVLKGNSNHHLDCLTIQTWVWGEYIKRGFLDKYRPELEMEHIYSGYLAGMKMLILRYEVPDYNVYLLLRELMLPRLGGYRDNPYIKMGALSEMHMLMLSALDTPLSKSQFLEFAESVKKIGI